VVTIESLVAKLRAERHWCAGSQFTDPSGCGFLLDVDVRTLRRWRARRVGPAWIAGGPRLVRYDLTDIVAWLNAGEKISPDKCGQERTNTGGGDGARAARSLISS
jgi:hypothetical protein